MNLLMNNNDRNQPDTSLIIELTSIRWDLYRGVGTSDQAARYHLPPDLIYREIPI
jgi:hypothetical protein